MTLVVIYWTGCIVQNDTVPTAQLAAVELLLLSGILRYESAVCEYRYLHAGYQYFIPSRTQVNVQGVLIIFQNH